MRQALVNENADLVRRKPPLCHAHHRQRQGRPGPARQLHRPGIEISRARHHLAAALDRRRCADLPPDRARPRGRLDDRVQADRRARHPRPRGHQEILLHADRLPRRDQPFRRPGFRRRAGADLRTRRGRSHRAARRRADHRRRRRDDPGPKPGADETVVDGPPDITMPPTAARSKKIYVDGVGATILAERVEYLDENGKLVTESPARLHQEGAEEALRQPRRFPQALEIGRAQAGDHRGTGSRGPAARRRSPRNSARTSTPSI